MEGLTEQRTREPGAAAEPAVPELTDPGLGQDCGLEDGRVQGAAMITSAGECGREQAPQGGAATAPAFS